MTAPLRLTAEQADTLRALAEGRCDIECWARDVLGIKLNPAQRRWLRLIRPVFVQSEIRYNPGRQYLGYVMPGVIGLTLQLLTVMLMAITIPRERERGTLDQLMASPITRLELILGKLLPFFGISLLNVATILFVTDRWFGIPVADRLPLLLLLCAG